MPGVSTDDLRRVAHQFDTALEVLDYLRFCSERTAHAGIRPDECRMLVEYVEMLQVAIAEVQD